MAKNQHVHKLKRFTFKSGAMQYFCILPDCSYKVNPALSLGKRSICHRCGREFILNEYSIRLAKPHCDRCHKPKIRTEVIREDDVKEIAASAVDSIRDRLKNSITTVLHAEAHDSDEDL